MDYIETEDSNLKSRWFQSDWDADLFIWTDVNKTGEKTTQEVIKYQLSFFGQIVEWSIFDGVRTGGIIESEISGEEPSEIIEFDKVPQAPSIAQAQRLLRFIDQLTVAEQDYLIDILKTSASSLQVVRQNKLGSLEQAIKDGQKQKSRSARSTFQSLLKWIGKIKK